MGTARPLWREWGHWRPSAVRGGTGDPNPLFPLQVPALWVPLPPTCVPDMAHAVPRGGWGPPCPAPLLLVPQGPEFHTLKSLHELPQVPSRGTLGTSGPPGTLCLVIPMPPIPLCPWAPSSVIYFLLSPPECVGLGGTVGPPVLSWGGGSPLGPSRIPLK